MSTAVRACRAITKSGAPCKNAAQVGGDFCHVHARGTSAAPSPRTAADPELARLVGELNQLAQEIQSPTPPPPFSPDRMLSLVKGNFERIASLLGLDAANQLLASLQGATAKDLVDPETWKGLYFILHALVTAQTETARTRILERLNALPGFALLTDLHAGLQGATAKDLVDPDTWKGLFYILDATARAQASDMKRRFLGEE